MRKGVEEREEEERRGRRRREGGKEGGVLGGSRKNFGHLLISLVSTTQQNASVLFD